jgi:hypothetical protein
MLEHIAIGIATIVGLVWLLTDVLAGVTGHDAPASPPPLDDREIPHKRAA